MLSLKLKNIQDIFHRISSLFYFKISLGNSQNTLTIFRYGYLKYQEELKKELLCIQGGLRRLEFYIHLLDKKYSNILTDIYIEEMTFDATAEKEKLSITAVKNNRRAAINKLVEMYNLVTE